MRQVWKDLLTQQRYIFVHYESRQHSYFHSKIETKYKTLTSTRQFPNITGEAAYSVCASSIPCKICPFRLAETKNCNGFTALAQWVLSVLPCNPCRILNETKAVTEIAALTYNLPSLCCGKLQRQLPTVNYRTKHIPEFPPQDRHPQNNQQEQAKNSPELPTQSQFQGKQNP